MYAIWHQPKGLTTIANRIRFRTEILLEEFKKLGIKVVTDTNKFFDTIVIDCHASGFSSSDYLLAEFHKNDINLRRVSENLAGITLNETTTIDDLADVIEIFAFIKNHCNEQGTYLSNTRFEDIVYKGMPSALARKTPFMQQSIFNSL